MMPLRASALPAALEKSCQPASSNGTPLAGTGVNATSFCTRAGASASTCCTALPPMECPIRLKRSQPSASASARASAEISCIVNSPCTLFAPP